MKACFHIFRAQAIYDLLEYSRTFEFKSMKLLIKSQSGHKGIILPVQSPRRHGLHENGEAFEEAPHPQGYEPGFGQATLDFWRGVRIGHSGHLVHHHHE
jgi:hypothetical protein